MKKSSLIRFEESNIELFGEAAHDNTAGGRVEELTVDPSVELAVLEAVDRVDEETDEDIVEETVDPSIEAILVAEERVDEFSVDPSIEAIQAAERIDKEAEGPKFESKLQ